MIGNGILLACNHQEFNFKVTDQIHPTRPLDLLQRRLWTSEFTAYDAGRGGSKGRTLPKARKGNSEKKRKKKGGGEK